MTTTTYTITSGAGSVATDAQFRAYGGGMSTALAAIGMVKTADTGQIDWATVTKPGAVNTQAGYEVWRFNDAMQATAPLYVRIGYGSSPSSAGMFTLWFTIGKGSDGAGAITGVITPQTQAPYVNTTGVATYTNYLSSGDGSALVIMLTPSGSGGSYLFVVVERSRTAAGVATGTGYVFALKATAANAPTVSATNYALSTTLAQVGWPAVTPVHTAMAAGGTAPVFPAVVTDGAGNFWQPRAVVSGHATDLGSLVAITVPGLGAYLPAPCQPWAGTSAYANMAAAFVWS